jgi:pyrroloquinoline-quinone synthase
VTQGEGPWSLQAAVVTLIEECHLLTHPFYTKWVEGDAPRRRRSRSTPASYYAFESSFPRFLSAILSRTEDRRARQSILDNLSDDEAGEDNHAELWLRFAEGMGVSRDDVRGVKRLAGRPEHRLPLARPEVRLATSLVY